MHPPHGKERDAEEIAVATAVVAARFVLGVTTPARADSGGIPYFDNSGNYIGCESSYTGYFFTPGEITYAGCISDWESNEPESQ